MAQGSETGATWDGIGDQIKSNKVEETGMGFLSGLERGASMFVKVLTTALWGAIGVGGFATGVWWIGLLAIAYLAYIWVWGGRWLIY